MSTDAQHSGWETWVDWRSYLTNDLGFSTNQITELQAGKYLGVYRDPRQNQCLALLYGEPNGTKKSLEKVSVIARENRAEFVALGRAAKYKLYQVGAYDLIPAPVSHLPSWLFNFRRHQPIPKEHVLPPFRDEEQLRKAFATCHDVIYTDSAKDPAAAFDLISLVIAAKVMDEQSDSSHYQFSEVAGESSEDACERLTALLNKARRWLYSQDLPEKDIPAVPRLRPVVASTILQQLQNFSLTLTGASAVGTDLLGVAYEQLVGSTFRGELGSYFTPRNIADFMVRLLDIRSGKVFDPSCGSGGLLVAAYRYAKGQAAPKGKLDLYGNDINHRMVEAAKVNFLAHQLNPNHVLYGDGLDLPRMLRRWFNSDSDQEVFPLWDGKPGPFDFVLANPPFAGHEKNVDILRRVATAYRADGSIRSLNKTLPFLELIVASLKEGGRAGIVIPTSILNAEEDSFTRFRELLLEHAELVAIIGLPEKAFVHTDCGVHGALLFFERRSKPRDSYKVFVGWADQLGYDRLGKPTRTSDFPELLDLFRRKEWPSNHSVSISQLRSYGRWDPTWLRVASTLPDTSEDFTQLGELLEVRNARWSRKLIKDDESYRYFEVADADLHTGRVQKVHEATGFELSKKGRIRNRVRTGDILLPNHRDSLMAASAANGRSVVVVDDSLDGVLTTDRFLVLRPKIDPTLLVTLLNSRGVRRQLVARCRGAASLDIREHTLTSVMVPRSLLQEKKATHVRNLAKKISRMREELDSTMAELSSAVESDFGSDAEVRPIAAR